MSRQVYIDSQPTQCTECFAVLDWSTGVLVVEPGALFRVQGGVLCLKCALPLLRRLTPEMK